jgi:hypothetical protein
MLLLSRYLKLKVKIKSNNFSSSKLQKKDARSGKNSLVKVELKANIA